MLTKEDQEAYYGAEARGVPTYMGPEVLRDFETYCAASDVWSLGCTIGFLMRNGKHVFSSNVNVLQYKGGAKKWWTCCFKEHLRLLLHPCQARVRHDSAKPRKASNSWAGVGHVYQ